MPTPTLISSDIYKVNCGENWQTTITAQDCQLIESILVDGLSQTIPDTHSKLIEFLNLQSDKKIEVYMKRDIVIVNVSPGPNGSTNKNGENRICKGSNLAIVITPNANYLIDTILVNNVAQTGFTNTGFTLNLNAVNANTNVVITFKTAIVQLNVTVNASGSGTVSQGSTVINSGATFSTLIRADPGFEIQSVNVSGIGNLSGYNKSLYQLDLPNITANTTITIVFAAAVYTVTVYRNIGQVQIVDGGVTINDAPYIKSVPSGGGIFLSVLGIGGNTLDYYLVNGTNRAFASNNESISIFGIGQNVVITIMNKNAPPPVLPTYTVTVNLGAGGKATQGTTANLANGANFSTQIRPNAGFLITSILLDGNAIVGFDPYSHTVGLTVQNNRTISVTFSAPVVLPTYTVTVNLGANGEASQGTKTVNSGDGFSTNIRPNSGYFISKITVDNVEILNVNQYDQTVNLTSIQANRVIVVTFAIVTFNVQIVFDAAQVSINKPANNTLSAGASFSVTATALSGFTLNVYSVNGGVQEPFTALISLPSVSENKVITIVCAVFQKQGCTDPTALNYDPTAAVSNGSCLIFRQSMAFIKFPSGEAAYAGINNGKYLGIRMFATDSSEPEISAPRIGYGNLNDYKNTSGDPQIFLKKGNVASNLASYSPSNILFLANQNSETTFVEVTINRQDGGYAKSLAYVQTNAQAIRANFVAARNWITGYSASDGIKINWITYCRDNLGGFASHCAPQPNTSKLKVVKNGSLILNQALTESNYGDSNSQFVWLNDTSAGVYEVTTEFIVKISNVNVRIYNSSTFRIG
jgi:hypothetical protein